MSKRLNTSFSFGTVASWMSSMLGKWFLGISVIYLVAHLFTLTSLPVFADEAIYIRWTQLIMDDWQRYLFFPLNDGKTPLQFWLMLPWQYLPIDQLASARLFVIMAGVLQIGVMGWLAKVFQGTNKAAVIAMALTAFLPFWYFHHSLFLLDSLLALWLSLFLGWSYLTMHQSSEFATKLSAQNSKRLILTATLAGFFFGLALLTKVPAILAIPALSVIILYKLTSMADFVYRCAAFAYSILVGLSMFALLSLHPAFSQLFARGSDFLFPFQSLIFDQTWKQTVPSFPNYAYTFIVYLTPAVAIFNLVSLFLHKHQSRAHILFWAGILFLFPIMLLGRVVYPRYLFPAALFFTLNAALCIDEIATILQTKKAGLVSLLIALSMATLLANTVVTSTQFIYTYASDATRLPLVSADKDQYLYSWSSGYGIQESVSVIQDIAINQKVAVATEGSFGTLPDGIMLYLHRQDVTNVFVDGIGYPLKTIPQSFYDKTMKFDRFLLIANSDRFQASEIPASELELIREFCKPDNAPCLQIWDFTKYRNQMLDSSSNTN